MKNLKSFLRIWIAITSILSFLGGWVVFSHSTKPGALFSGSNSAAAQSATLLTPIPSLDSLISDTSGSAQTTLQALPALQLSAQSSASSTMLRTRGS